MREAQLGARTVRSHGVTLAKTHMHDWLILVLLGVILVILNVIHPFNRFVGKDMMSDLKYPLKSNTVPISAGILFSGLITAVLTDAIKDAVGRPRPNFFWRCFPDGKDDYGKWGNVICHGDKGVIREGHKSFPSGYTSWSFAGLGFQSLYLSGKISFLIVKACCKTLPSCTTSACCISCWHISSG